MAKEKVTVVDEGVPASKTGTEVVPAQAGAVTTVNVQARAVLARCAWGAVRQGLSRWKSASGETPELGSLYLHRGTSGYHFVAAPGADNARRFIAVSASEGYMESKQFDGVPPKRWIVGETDAKSGKVPATKAECLALARAEGFDLTQPVPDGVWPDSGKPRYKRAAPDGKKPLTNVCHFVGLMEIPDTFTSNEFDLVVIGGALYTPVAFEFAAQHFDAAMGSLNNIRNRMEAKHYNDPEWKFSPEALRFRLGTKLEESRKLKGTFYGAPLLTYRVDDTLDEKELKDFASVMTNISVDTAEYAGDGDL